MSIHIAVQTSVHSYRNPYLTLLLGDYNARNTNWWHHDITTTEGIQLETTTTIYGLQQ